MRINNPVFRRGTAAAVIAIVLLVGTPAAAQGFLESLFGVFALKPQPQLQVAPRQGQSPASGEARQNPFDRGWRKWSSAGGGRYKTMCVRLCDGFYFPISNDAPRRNFYRDAEICQSQCDSATRLFFMPKTSGSIEQARDQSGLNYEELANAFVYRKKLDQSCTCRAKPWSDAERARHKRYAMIEAGELDLKAAELEAEPDDGEKTVADRAEDVTQITPARPRLARLSFETQTAQRPPGRAVSESVAVAKKPMATPLFGLGALFFAGGTSPPTKPKHYKKTFHWPGDDGN